MSPDSLRARRIGTRLIAAAATGAVVAAAFAAPAAAAVPGIVGDPLVTLSLGSTVTAGASTPGSITVDYTPAEGSENDTHVVTAELTVEGSADVVELTPADAACDASTAYLLACTDDAADADTAFAFDLGAVASAEDETFGYTLKVLIDGIEVATKSGNFGVLSTYDVHNPYAHGNVAVTDVASSSFSLVNPVFYQDFDLAPTAVAAVVEFSNPVPGGGIDTSGLASALDSFSNCRTTYVDSVASGIECVVTDVPDAKGQFLTLTKGVNYQIGSRVVGPLDLCACTYSVETINAATFADEYGNGSWFSTTGTALGITTAAAGWEGAEDSIAYYSGDITLTTVDNTYDLEVSETFIEGMVGDTVTVTTSVANNGPAIADDLNEESNSYLVRAQLPPGTELVRVDSDGNGVWECRDASELDEVYAATPNTALERFDFACALDKFRTNVEPELTFTVKLTDTTAFQGAIEIGAVYGDGEFEGDATSDFALVYNDAYAALYDYNQDDYEDLLVIRKSDGALMLYKGSSSGKYLSGVVVSSGWGKFDIVMGGDLTGDDLPDLLARDNKTGTLYTYPGNGKGGFGTPVNAGAGWGKMGQIAVGNFDGDGNPDIFATAYADGNMYYYPGLGNGKFGSKVMWSEFWDGMDVISSVGDLDHDGYDEFLSRWNYDGRYYLYTSTGEVLELDQSLYVGDDSRRFDQVVGVGDLTRDGTPDIVAPNLKNGELVRYTIDTEWPGYNPGTVIGSGWNGVRLPVIQLDRNYDFDYNGFGDVIAHQKTSGDLFIYWGSRTGIGSRVNICDNCTGISGAVAGGDYNSDGRTDLVYRTKAGELYIAPGLDTGELGFGAAVKIGTGWDAMANITGGHDYNNDGKDDLIARHPATGYLYLYPGKGNGSLGSRVKIGTGWNAMREITDVGDFNHDGNADMLAIRSSDTCLYLYAGRGDGTLRPGVKTTCGWGGYDQITGIGDLNRDGHTDWIGRRKSDGALFLYHGNGTSGYSSRKQIGTGWNSMSYLA
jgi:hypothetical protein